MTFVLLRSSAFVREARKIVKKQPNIAQNIQKTLTILTTDPFYPQFTVYSLLFTRYSLLIPHSS